MDDGAKRPLPVLFAEMVRTQRFVPVDWNKQDYRVAHWLISLIHFRAMLGFSSAYGPTDVQSQFHHEQTSLHIYHVFTGCNSQKKNASMAVTPNRQLES